MASIVTRTISDGSKSYQVRWREHGKWRSEMGSGATEKARLASAKRIQRLVEAHGTYRPEMGLRDVPTLREVAEQYLQHGTRANAATAEDYRRTLERHVYPTFGDTTLPGITRDMVSAWGRSIPGSDKTRANVLALLSGILKYAVPEHLPANPCDRVRLPKTDLPRDRHLITSRDFGLIVEEIPEHYQPLVVTLGMTGMRWGEATALTIGDVDLTQPAPRFKVTKAVKHRATQTDAPGVPKTSRSVRVVTGPPELVPSLLPLMQRPRGELLFTAIRGGRMRNSTFHTLVWQPAVRAAEEKGLPYRPRVHDLRAAATTWLIEAGVPIDVVADQLGHESIDTTMRIYRRFNPESGKRVAAAMSDVMSDVIRLALERTPVLALESTGVVPH